MLRGRLVRLLRSVKKSMGEDMARNFGLGSRNMSKAGQFAMNNAITTGSVSFSHAAEVGRNFAKFAEFAKVNGVKQMEYITRDLVKNYGQQLAQEVKAGKISSGHAQNQLSAINTVMREATRGGWQSVRSVKDCNTQTRNDIRTTAPTGLDRAQLNNASQALSERGQAIVGLARELGLRAKETSLLNAHAALREASMRGAITISDGAKNGRGREITLTSTRQTAALERAAQAQGNAKAVMPSDKNWKEWKENGLRSIRETLQQHGISRLHDLRSSFACERYEALSGHKAPCMGGSAPRAADRTARLQIARELGHNRTDITNSYLGAHT